ncbi:hypothetical protein GGR52DRAFT_415331 [Hypoxylon sp. FL1284]|nr:hypothetical protein GGR52DRAFT_415331 [Hypoxylon sp. FL1284]
MMAGLLFIVSSSLLLPTPFLPPLSPFAPPNPRCDATDGDKNQHALHCLAPYLCDNPAPSRRPFELKPIHIAELAVRAENRMEPLSDTNGIYERHAPH